MREYRFDLKSVELTKEKISSFDLVILATDHDSFDYTMIEEGSNFIIDTRGKFRISDKILFFFYQICGNKYTTPSF